MFPPLVLSIVPPAIVNVPATVPSACVLLMFNVPALSVVPPVKVFVPEKQSGMVLPQAVFYAFVIIINIPCFF